MNQALCGAALSIGTNIEIIDIPGYAPLYNGPNLINLAKDAADQIIPEAGFNISHSYSSGSTDMGDLSCIMPVIHPYAGGAKGAGHGADYQIADPEAACVGSAKWQLGMLHLLLKDDAVRAKQIIADYKPQFPSKEAYLSYMDSINSSGDRISYREDGTAEVRIS